VLRLLFTARVKLRKLQTCYKNKLYFQWFLVIVLTVYRAGDNSPSFVLPLLYSRCPVSCLIWLCFANPKRHMGRLKHLYTARVQRVTVAWVSCGSCSIALTYWGQLRRDPFGLRKCFPKRNVFQLRTGNNVQCRELKKYFTTGKRFPGCQLKWGALWLWFYSFRAHVGVWRDNAIAFQQAFVFYNHIFSSKWCLYIFGEISRTKTTCKFILASIPIFDVTRNSYSVPSRPINCSKISFGHAAKHKLCNRKPTYF